MTFDQFIIALPGIGALILSIYQQASLNRQNKRTADLDEAKNKFSQEMALLEQQRQLINTMQGLMKDQATGGISMQSQLDDLNKKIDRMANKSLPSKPARSKEANDNLLRSKEIMMKLDALKPIERE